MQQRKKGTLGNSTSENDQEHRVPVHRRKHSFEKFNIQLIIIFLLIVSNIYFIRQTYNHKERHRLISKETNLLIETHDEHEKSMNQVEQDVSDQMKLRANELIRVKEELRNVQELVLQLESSNEAKEKDAQIDQYKKRDKAFQSQIKLLQEAVAKYSRQLIKYEFGKTSGTVFVELQLKFPSVMGSPIQDSIVIETAPVELMPTAVYYWLKQIDMGLWNGCSFFRNAGHVLQASSRGVNKEQYYRRFKRLDDITESIPFQEYTSDYSHKKYTLGIAGRPGGPDFYINLVNNVKNHGPGGQSSYDIKEEADSCFAKVITEDNGKSIEVVKRMHTSKRLPGSFQEMADYIGIEEAKILKDPPF